MSNTRGAIAGRFLADYALELSRGFKALKIWMAMKENGAAKFGRLIDQNIAQARHFSALVESSSELEIVSPTAINIVCFQPRLPGHSEAEIKAVNTEIVLRLQEEGLAVISDTTVAGKHCMRIAINNHRTRREDLDFLLSQILHIGGEVSGQPRQRSPA